MARKQLRYRRHAKNVGGIVGQEELDRIQNIASDQNNPLSDEMSITDAFHGTLIRTAQTAIAWLTADGQEPRVHQPIPEIGSDDLFKEMANDEFKIAQKSMSNIEALVAVHTPEKVVEYTTNAGEGVRKMLDLIEDDGVAEAFGHDPVIPLAAKAFGADVPSLKELEYIDFIWEDGNITVVDPRG